MPAIQCPNGKWKWGAKGLCVYDSKAHAERAGKAIKAKQSERKKNDK